MKKKENHISYNFKPMKLYYEDIEDIYKIFREHTEDIKIEADEYKLERIDEVIDIDKKYFTSLKINIYEPYVSIDFSQNSIRLYASDDTPLQRGLFEKLKAILLKKERFILSKLLTYKAFFLFLLISSTISLWDNIYIRSIIGISCVITYITVVYYNLKLYSIIIPIKRASQLGYFKRNKDQLITSSISAILGGIIVLIITKLLEK